MIVAGEKIKRGDLVEVCDGVAYRYDPPEETVQVHLGYNDETGYWQWWQTKPSREEG